MQKRHVADMCRNSAWLTATQRKDNAGGHFKTLQDTSTVSIGVSHHCLYWAITPSGREIAYPAHGDVKMGGRSALPSELDRALPVSGEISDAPAMTDMELPGSAPQEPLPGVPPGAARAGVVS
jgi:hypothetical protein